MSSFIVDVDEAVLQRERAKARELRDGQWWRSQIGKGRCYYCGGQFRPADLSMDHKTPLVRGGRSSKNNLVPACKVCNNEKKYLLLSEWIAAREAEGRPLACARHELT